MIPALVLGGIILVGLLFLIIGIGLSRNAKKKLRVCTAVTSAKVKRNVRADSVTFGASSPYLAYPVFEYYVGEEKYEREYAIGTSKVRYQEGQTVNIFYNPKKPTMFYVQGDRLQSKLGTIFKIVGIVCILTAIVSGIIVTVAINSIL